MTSLLGHLNAGHPDTAAWLRREVGYLDDFVVNALLADETRPRILPVGEGILLILRGVNLNENASPEDMVSIRLWIDPHRIISLQRRKLKAVGDLAANIEAGQGPVDSAGFITTLIGLLFARMAPAVTSLGEEMDDIEEDVLDGSANALREQIVSIRKKAIIFKRYMAPQRDLITNLLETKIDWFADRNHHHMIEAHDNITRFVEELDSVRERSQVISDEVTNILTERLNKNMYALSVVAAIFLPLGFLTGLLGINIGGIPGAESPQAFVVFCGMLALVVGLQIVIFRKMRWF
jgi:zinc transporter